VRILHVNKFLYRRGGAEGYMLDVADLQKKAGHEVGFWGMRHPDNLSALELADTFPPNVELDPAPGGLGGVAAGARMVYSPSSRRGMDEALSRFRPDVVHCHNIYHQLSPSILAPLRKRGVPCVMTLHDYKLACPSYQMLNKGQLCQLCVTGGTWHAVKERCKGGSLAASTTLAVESGIHRITSAYAPVDVFVSPSRFLSDIMRRAGVAPERLRVVSHFVDLHDVPQSTGTGDRFLFAGRLSSEKGIDTLITALSLLPKGTQLDIAGEGPVRPALERQAAELVPGQVTFHGRLQAPQLRGLFTRSVASVVPSRWYENQPMSILESFAASVPVVATNLGGMPELVRTEKDGIVVPHDDPPALARALSRLDGDRSWAHRLGAHARARLE
jgi:glycosyltransferase involved in cell wall biosynthesis